MLLRALREVSGLCRPDGTIRIDLKANGHTAAIKVMLATGLLEVDAGAAGLDGFITYRLTPKALLLADMRPMRTAPARTPSTCRLGASA
jgi:hypothetical protein